MNPRDKKTILWGLVVALASAVLYCLHPLDWAKYRQLDSQGRGASGWVTAKDPATLEVYYSFPAGNRTVSGKGRVSDGRAGFEALSQGDRVFVSYLPSDPSVSIPDDPKNFLAVQSAVLIWTLILAIATAIWFLVTELRKVPPR